MSKLIIHVENGMVQSVYSNSNEKIEVTIIDLDSDDPDVVENNETLLSDLINIENVKEIY